jgi:hypothetical protein
MGFERALGVGKKENRKKNDFYPTHPYVTYSLLREEEHFGYVPEKIIEPCSGKGWMARELLDYDNIKIEVDARDLFEYEETLCNVNFGYDFLKTDYSRTKAAITNPPYNNDLP